VSRLGPGRDGGGGGCSRGAGAWWSSPRHAFNEVVSFVAGWALSLDYILTIAISAFFVPHYLGAFWPALTHGPGDVIGGLIVIAVLAWLNIRGIGESAKLNFFLAIADLVTQVIIIIVGAFLVLKPSLLVRQVHLGTVPTYPKVIFALSLAMLAYTGVENVSNMAKGERVPDRDIPHALGYYVAILAGTILFIATNAGLIGISRLSWSRAEHRQLPTIFSRLHSRYRTPWFTIVVFSVFAGILLIPGKTDFLGNLYSFGAMLSFTTAHAAVIALRIKDPDRERPYRMPWNIRFRGRQIPLTAVLGGIGTFAAWVSVLALHVEARTVGVGWMV